MKKRAGSNIDKATDVKTLRELKKMPDKSGAYKWQEVKKFGTQYNLGAPVETLSSLVDVAMRWFNYKLNLEDHEKVDFKIKAGEYIEACVEMPPRFLL